MATKRIKDGQKPEALLRAIYRPADKPIDITWPVIEAALSVVDQQIRAANYTPAIIVGISRGGLIPAAMLAFSLGVKDVRSIRIQRYGNIFTESYQATLDGPDVLFVDDLWDSGETQRFLSKMYPRARRAVLFEKDAAELEMEMEMGQARAHFRAYDLPHKWVNFPWDHEGMPPHVVQDEPQALPF